MHGSTVGLSTVGVAFNAIMGYGALLVALAVCIDAARRRAGDFDGSIVGGRWSWIVPNALFLLGVALGFAGVRHIALTTIVGVLYVLVLVLDLAYLLRVVYPSPSRRTARDLAASTLRHVPVEHRAEDSDLEPFG